jgi:molybdate transport system substrate-binding protein
MRPLKAAATIAVLSLTASGCAGTSQDTGSDEPLHGEVLVSAAASLTDAFEDIADAFEAANPGVDVVLNLAGSSALREQILEGAPVDVFASADRANMEAVIASRPALSPAETFAANRMDVAVPSGNPAGIERLGDLARGDLLVGLCAAAVPCGDLARAALAEAGVSASVDTNEPNARALLAKVAEGELDVAISYLTDITSAGGRVEGLGLDELLNVGADYRIAALGDGSGESAATAFVAFVLSEAGRGILAAHGFLLP